MFLVTLNPDRVTRRGEEVQPILGDVRISGGAWWSQRATFLESRDTWFNVADHVEDVNTQVELDTVLSRWRTAVSSLLRWFRQMNSRRRRLYRLDESSGGYALTWVPFVASVLPRLTFCGAIEERLVNDGHPGRCGRGRRRYCCQYRVKNARRLSMCESYPLYVWPSLQAMT